MSRRCYFPVAAGAPAALRLTVHRKVRFEEVDPLGVVWHGRYPSYLEDARVAIGDKYGVGYMDFRDNGVATPIRQMRLDYHRPLVFPDEFAIEVIMHWTEAARINMEFVIRDAAGLVATTGSTVQMFIDASGELLVVQPEFYREFCERWRRGEVEGA